MLQSIDSSGGSDGEIAVYKRMIEVQTELLIIDRCGIMRHAFQCYGVCLV